MNNKGSIPLLAKILDWKEFEKLIESLYSTEHQFEVTHNVTEIGKSGVKRQIDVLVTQKSKLHKIKLLIECKYLKVKIDRHIVDELYTSIEDLSANKGVIFTTVGFDSGAKQYAEYKGIDIFVVRDIRDDEWSYPGRHIWFYNQFFQANLASEIFKIKQFHVLNGTKLSDDFVFDIQVGISFPVIRKPENQTFFVNLEQPTDDLVIGPNLVDIMIRVHEYMLNEIYTNFNHLLIPEEADHKEVIVSKAIVDFDNYPFRFLMKKNVIAELDKIILRVDQSINQSKFLFDRLETSDFALVVENVLTKARNIFSKSVDGEKIF